MATLNIAAIRAASTTPQTKELTLPDALGTVLIRRLSFGDMVEAGTLPTPRERTARLFALGVVDPELSPDDIAALLDDPALTPVAQALSAGLNDWNGTAAPPQEVIKADHAAFRPRADEPDAPDGAGPVPV